VRNAEKRRRDGSDIEGPDALGISLSGSVIKLDEFLSDLVSGHGESNVWKQCGQSHTPPACLPEILGPEDVCPAPVVSRRQKGDRREGDRREGGREGG
jgi:hypothetical protein